MGVHDASCPHATPAHTSVPPLQSHTSRAAPTDKPSAGKTRSARSASAPRQGIAPPSKPLGGTTRSATGDLGWRDPDDCPHHLDFQGEDQQWEVLKACARDAHTQEHAQVQSMWGKLGLALSANMVDNQVLTAACAAHEPDEEIICNDFGKSVRTSVGVPPDCAHAAALPPRTSDVSAQIPLQDRRHPGGRLRRWNKATLSWESFFGPGGAGAPFADQEATRLATRGWAPQCLANPIQRRLPRMRHLEPGAAATATDGLVHEYVDKRIVEEVGEPCLAHMTKPLWSLDTAMVHMAGIPFKVPRTVYAWVHDFFLVPKPHSDKWRGITNAKPYNEWCFKKRFKLNGFKQMQSVLRSGDYIAGYDIQDFFPHVGLEEHFRDHFLFRHKFQGENCVRWFRFVSLMFGTTDAPRSCVRLMLPVLAFLRSCDARLAQFIDDGMVADQPEQRCVEMFQLVVNLLDHLGFILHASKCKPQPSQKRLFLGSVADSSHHLYVTLRLPASKIKGIKRSMQSTWSQLKAGKLTLRGLAASLGKARAARDSVTICYLMTREMLRWQNAAIMVQLVASGLVPRRQPFMDEEMVFEPHKFELPDEAADLHSNKNKTWFQFINWDVQLCDPVLGLPRAWRVRRLPRFKSEIDFWSEELPMWNGKWLTGAPPPHGMQQRHWQSDASGYGAGLVNASPDLLDYESRFHWLPQEEPMSINWKELACPEMGMQAVAKRYKGAFQNKLINGELDNTAAVSYISRQGGPMEHLSVLAENLWFWLLRQKSWILVRHLAGILNVRADKASRWRDDRQEWRLSDEAFNEVEQAFGPHTIDLFASRRNTQLPRFFSRWLDPDSAATDALKRPWLCEGNAYAHPPIAIIPQVIAKLKAEGSEITLVAPVWASQAWISDLLQLSVALPRLLLSETLVEPCLPTRHPISQPGWMTAVWRLSGDDSKPKVTNKALRAALWPQRQTAT